MAHVTIRDIWKPDGMSGLTDYVGLLTRDQIQQLAPNLISPTPPLDSKLYQVASVDLTAGAIICRDKQAIDQHLLAEESGIKLRESRLTRLLEFMSLRIGENTVHLDPGGVAIVITREEVRVPINMAGNSLPIIAQARDGLLGLSYGHIDPGYIGHLAVRLLNIRRSPFAITLGEPIITVTLQQLAKPADEYQPYEANDFRAMLHRTQQAVLDTAPAAVLDIQGEGIGNLVELEIRQQVSRSRARNIAFLLGAATVGGAIVAVVQNLAPHIKFVP